MALPRLEMQCNECGARFTGVPKRSFLGYLRLPCVECAEMVTYPLTNGYRITYCVLLGLFLLQTLAEFAAAARIEVAISQAVGRLVWCLAFAVALGIDYELRARVAKQASEAPPPAPLPAAAAPAESPGDRSGRS